VRELPTGKVTFLFTDVEGSTRLLQEHGERYAELLAEHRAFCVRRADDGWVRCEFACGSGERAISFGANASNRDRVRRHFIGRSARAGRRTTAP
jgi:class 3 adenylate cyclase